MKNNIIFYFLFIFITSNVLFAQLAWKEFGFMQYPRELHCAVAISDHEVLVIGGYNTITDEDLATCEIIDIINDTILPGPSMNTPRAYFVTLVTKDTNIIVISGCTRSMNILTPTVELYDKKLKNWKLIGNLKIPRWQHNAEFLNDHEILIVGGRHGNTDVMDDVEIFDINTGLSRLVNPYLFPTSDGVSGYTSNNKLLFFGGRDGGVNSNRTKYIYRYDKINDWWIIDDSLNSKVQIPYMMKLWDKKLLLVGGSHWESPTDFSKEIYLEKNGDFSLAGMMMVERIRFAMSEFNSDTVIIIGGLTNSGSNTNKCDWFIPKINGVTVAPSLNYSRHNFCSVSLPGNEHNVILAIGGLVNGTSTKSIEILEQDIPSDPPKLTQSSSDCSNYYFTVTDVNGIDKVELTGTSNFNVKISVNETLPSTVVHVKVSLIDPNQNGVFNVTCYCYTTNKTIDVSGVINRNPSVLKVLAPLDSGKIIVGKTPSGTLKCIKVLILNTGSQDFVLDYARLDTNIEFSIPQAQLPLIIPPGDTAELELCYLPSSLEEQFDTLSLGDLCDTLRIPVKAIGDTVFYTGKSNCGIPIKGKTLIPGNSILVGNPYPNPGSEIVSINVTENFESSVKCYLYDYKAEFIKNSEAIEKDKWQTGSVEFIEKEYSICLTDVSTGMYFIVVETIDGKRIFPYFVMR